VLALHARSAAPTNSSPPSTLATAGGRVATWMVLRAPAHTGPAAGGE
jgi:hypothetical protein